MKLRKQTTKFLSHAVLASTVFCLFPSVSHAVLVSLNAGANGQNSTNPTYPPTDGYDYVVPNVSFSIVSGDNIGTTAGTSVDNSSNSAGDVLNFQGNSVVAGNVGPTNGIGTINLQGAAGKTVQFQGLTLTPGSGGLIFTANGSAQLASGITLTGKVDSTAAGTGSLEFLGGGKITGTIGATNSLNNIILSGASNTVTFTQSIKTTNGLLFKGASDANTIARFEDTVTVSGIIDNQTGTAGNGSLLFAGSGTVNNTIGATDSLANITLIGAGKTVNFNDNVTANNLIFGVGASTGTIATLLDNKTFDGNIDNQSGTNNIGAFQLRGTGTITGNIGVTKALLQVAINSTGTASETGTLKGSTINALNIFVNDDTANGSTLLLDNAAMNLTSTITTRTTNLNTVNIHNAAIINGDIGTSAKIFNLVKVAALSPLTLNGNVFATKVTFQADNAVTVSSDKNINAAVTTLAANTGSLIFAGNSSVTSPIGVAGTPLKLVDVNGPQNTTVTLSNNIFATDTKVDNGGTLLVSKAITINGDLSILNNKSALSLATAANPVNVTGDFDLAANTRLLLNLNNGITTGELVAAGTANVDPTATLTILNVPMAIADGTTPIPVLKGAVGSTLNPIDVTNNDSLLLKFTTSVNAPGTELSLVIKSIPVTNFANQTNTIGIAKALDIIVDQAQFTNTPVRGVLGDVINQLPTFQDVGVLNQQLAELAPTVSGSITQGSFSNQYLIGRTIVEHLGHAPYQAPEIYEIRDDQGYNSGDLIGADSGTWMALVGQSAHQKNREGILGYREKTFGVIMGYDTRISTCSSLGVAGSWTTAQIHENISAGSTAHAHSYQFTLYGQYAPDSPFYANWLGAFAFNQYRANRNVTFGTLFLQPSAHFQGYQYGGQAELGYDYVNNCIHTVPLINVFYSNLLLKKYTEHDVGNAAQTIQHSHFNALLGGVGLKFAYDGFWCDMYFQPEVHVRAFYDFQDDRMTLTSQFIGAGPSFETVGIKPPRDSYNIGACLKTISVSRRLIFTVNYDFNFKEDYTAHSGFLQLRYEW